MHVLFLPSTYSTTDQPWRGSFVKEQARALTAAGMRTGIAFVERRGVSGLNVFRALQQRFQTTADDRDGITTLRTKGWSTGTSMWTRLTRRLVRAYVEQHGVPDLIHAHSAMAGHTAMLAAYELKRPYVVSETEVATAEAAEVYRNAAAVIAAGSQLRERVDEVAGGTVTEVVPNAVDSEYFHLPNQPRGRFFTFLAITDQPEIVHRAFDLFRTTGRRARLIVAGSRLPRWHVRAWLWDASALVVPNADHGMLLEAMATGLPVIATRGSGAEELVPIDAGVLVDREDAGTLSDAMAQLLVRRFDAERIRASVINRHGYAAVARRLSAVYYKALNWHREVA